MKLTLEEAVFFEWMHKRLNGTIFPTEVTLISFERNNKKVLQATVRDITNRKNQERALAITAVVFPLKSGPP
jgi:PAS domain S-box-containing protein